MAKKAEIQEAMLIFFCPNCGIECRGWPDVEWECTGCDVMLKPVIFTDDWRVVVSPIPDEIDEA